MIFLTWQGCILVIKVQFRVQFNLWKLYYILVLTRENSKVWKIRVENTFDYFWNETFLLVIFKCILIFCPSEFAALAYALRSQGSISSIDGQVSACNNNEVWHKTILEELGSLDNECTWENLENTRRKIPNENTVVNTNGWMHFCYLRYYYCGDANAIVATIHPQIVFVHLLCCRLLFYAYQ